MITQSRKSFENQLAKDARSYQKRKRNRQLRFDKEREERLKALEEVQCKIDKANKQLKRPFHRV